MVLFIEFWFSKCFTAFYISLVRSRCLVLIYPRRYLASKKSSEPFSEFCQYRPSILPTQPTIIVISAMFSILYCYPNVAISPNFFFINGLIEGTIDVLVCSDQRSSSPNSGGRLMASWYGLFLSSDYFLLCFLIYTVSSKRACDGNFCPQTMSFLASNAIRYSRVLPEKIDQD